MLGPQGCLPRTPTALHPASSAALPSQGEERAPLLPPAQHGRSPKAPDADALQVQAPYLLLISRP
jgi:hypothetical protein